MAQVGAEWPISQRDPFCEPLRYLYVQQKPRLFSQWLIFLLGWYMLFCYGYSVKLVIELADAVIQSHVAKVKQILMIV